MYSKLLYYNELNIEAPVAQLDRASVYGTGSWGFESLQACFFFVGVIHKQTITFGKYSSNPYPLSPLLVVVASYFRRPSECMTLDRGMSC